MSEFVTVAKVGDIRAGEGAAFEVSGRMVAVFLQDGEYLAIDDMCPHAGASLACGFVEGHEVTCPWHAWRFDIRDGTWCDNRRLKVDTFDVRVVGDQIQVRPQPSGQADNADDAPLDDHSVACASDDGANQDGANQDGANQDRADHDRHIEPANENQAREDSEPDEPAGDAPCH